MNSEFADYYKKISNTELFDILNNVNDYQVSAVDAAMNELNSRNLSEEEIDMAKAPLVASQLKQEELAEKKRITEGKLKAVSDTIYHAIKPDETPEKLVDKKILFIVIICGIFYLVTLLTRFHDIFNIVDAITESPFFVFIYLLPLPGTPIALFTFYKRKEIGWSLLAAILAFNAAGNLVIWYKIIFTKIPKYYYSSYLYRSPVTGSNIFYVFILLSIIFVICKKDIRQLYHIDTPKMAGLLFLGALANVIISKKLNRSFNQ